MGIGALILLFAIGAGEVFSLMKLKKQAKRIKDLEEKAD